MAGRCSSVSPSSNGQTKTGSRPRRPPAIVERRVKDQFDHWLAGNPVAGQPSPRFVGERAEERILRARKGISRRSADAQAAPARQAADCTNTAADGSKSSSSRAIRPAASANRRATRQPGYPAAAAAKNSQRGERRQDKLAAEPAARRPRLQALGCGTGAHYRYEDLRYGKDAFRDDGADVDAPILWRRCSSLLRPPDSAAQSTRPSSLAVPPLYRSPRRQGVHARNDKFTRTSHAGRVSPRQCQRRNGRFKARRDDAGHRKETTMDPPSARCQVMLVATTVRRYGGNRWSG